MKPPDLATLVHENICSQHDIENTVYYLRYAETFYTSADAVKTSPI